MNRLAVFLLVSALSGCGQQAVKCSDTEVQDRVKELIAEILEPKAVELESITPLFLGQKVDLSVVISKIENIRETSTYESTIQMRHCAATATTKVTTGDDTVDAKIVEKGSRLTGQSDLFPLIFNGVDRAVDYTVQILENGDHYINVTLPE